MTANRDPLSYSMPLAINVRNATGSALPSGSLVYISGYHTASGNVTVAAADADGTIGTQIAEMILPATIANSANGIAYRTSLMDGTLDTSGAAVGDPVYLSATAGTPTLTAPTTSIAVRQIVGRVVVLGSTATNGRVLYHFMTPASVQAVSSTQMQATNRVRTLFLPYSTARAIATNDIPAIAVGSTFGSAGILGSDSGGRPKLTRANAATDIMATATWASSSNVELQWDTMLPSDLDVASAVTLSAYAKSGGATDTPVLTFKAFAGVGGADAGGNTGALAATVAVVTKSIAASTFTAATLPLSIALLTGAHTTDTVIAYGGVWLTYTSK